jgi:hypothetical protein
MEGVVAPTVICGNNERVKTYGTEMPQDRWPIITTSVSGISADDWTLFKQTAKKRNLKYQQAMEHALAQLISDIRLKHHITWEPSRPAKSKPIKIHSDTINAVRELAEKFDYRQNVIILTAMRRWINNPKSKLSDHDDIKELILSVVEDLTRPR